VKNLVNHLFKYLFLLIPSLGYSMLFNGMNLFTDQLHYDQNSNSFIAKKNILIVRDDDLLLADEFEFDTKTHSWKFKGLVMLQEHDGHIVTGYDLMAEDHFNQLEFRNGFLSFPKNNMTITADRIERNYNEFDFDTPCYTACMRGVFKNPIWQVRAKTANFNSKTQVVKAKKVRFEVFGKPVFFMPYVKFTGPKSVYQNGFLIPSISYGKTLNTPFYIRRKSNMDLTITPRFKLKPTNVIMEGEFNHLTSSGSYKVQGSVMRTNEFSKDKPVLQYHLFSNGQFKIKDYDAGFNLKRTRNGGYLKKYYDIQDPYLVSDIWMQKVNGPDYIRLEALDFQDLRSEDERSFWLQDTFLAPVIRTKKVWNIGDDLYLSLQNNHLFYKAGSRYNVLRTSNALELTKIIQIYDHQIDLSIYDKFDLYGYKYRCLDQNDTGIFVRNLPEIHTTWRYQIFNNNFIIEPVASFNASLAKYKELKIPPIDSDKNDLADDLNLFRHNMFYGKDYDEHKKRLSYGVNFLFLDRNVYSAFLGKKHDLYDPGRSQIVGSASISNKSAEIYYKFNLSNKFKLNLAQLGITRFTDDWSLDVSLFNVRYKASRILGLGTNVRYNLNNNWAIGGGANVDLAKNPFILTKSVEVTYNYDCVRIFAKMESNFSKDGLDKKRRKTWSDFSFQIGLKTLNM